MDNAPSVITRALDLPAVFKPFISPARYKAAWGGRGGSKSWGFATLALLYAGMRPGLRLMAVREYQSSLAQSSKRLIEDRIDAAGLSERDGFRSMSDRTILPGDGLVTYVGMQDHNADTIKSFEGYDVAWVEEAQSLSQRSLDLLRPTIRAAGSELWFSWNPRRKSDPVDMLFRGGPPPSDSLVLRVNWRDNPWFPPVLEQERRDCLANDPDNYEHIWEGGYATVTRGAYYARQLAEARAQGRIGRVPADPHLPYRVYCDIGGTGARADAFAMWVAQFVGREIRVLDYYEARGQELGAHLHWLRSRGYTPGRAQIWLPHDGATQDRVYAVSYESAFRAAGYEVPPPVPNQGRGAAAARIEAARKLFPAMWFHAEACEAGLDALGNYHERWDDARNVGLGPEHDWASHGADALGLMAVAYEPPTTTAPRKPEREKRYGDDYGAPGGRVY